MKRASRRILAPALVAFVALVAVPAAASEQAGSKQRRLAAGYVDGGVAHTCARLKGGLVRCWGFGGNGRLGYGNTDSIGDNETPASVGPVNLGPGRRAVAIATGNNHSCAILDNGKVQCWGRADNGQLGYGNVNNIGDNELPSSVTPVALGAPAVAITAGTDHTCALLKGGAVRCWGAGSSGRLGYGNTDTIGDDETPASVGPVDLGAGRRAVAIAAGDAHTCVILNTGAVRCWGSAGSGRLGYGNATVIGDDETPGSAGPVNLGAGRRAVAVSAGGMHTCAILDTGRVRCWGSGANGRLGYGNTATIGDDETPNSAGPVGLGSGRKAVAITAGFAFTCAVLDNGAVRCWGASTLGQLGYGNADSIGDDETPASVGPVKLGAGRHAVAVVASSGNHACAVLDTGALRCWGGNSSGQLGYVGAGAIGDDETPDAAGPVSLGRAVATKLKPALSLALKPKRDPTVPYAFRATGKLGGFLADPATCSGKVVVRAKSGGRTVVKRPYLKLESGSCSYAARFLVTAAAAWKVTATFVGNGSLLTRKTRAKRFAAG